MPPWRGGGDLPSSPAPTLGSASAGNVKTTDTQLIGAAGGGPLRYVSREGLPVLGFRYRLGSLAGQGGVASLEPLFTREEPPRPWESVIARNGYAVAAMQVDADQFLIAIRVAFMRIDGNHLDTKDSYVSDWIGHPTGRTPQTINGDGARVMGIHGRRMALMHAVGLVFEAE